MAERDIAEQEIERLRAENAELKDAVVMWQLAAGEAREAVSDLCEQLNGRHTGCSCCADGWHDDE